MSNTRATTMVNAVNMPKFALGMKSETAMQTKLPAKMIDVTISLAPTSTMAR